MRLQDEVTELYFKNKAYFIQYKKEWMRVFGRTSNNIRIKNQSVL